MLRYYALRVASFCSFGLLGSRLSAHVQPFKLPLPYLALGHLGRASTRRARPFLELLRRLAAHGPHAGNAFVLQVNLDATVFSGNPI